MSSACASGENSACGALPAMTNINRWVRFGSLWVTFSKRLCTPGGKEITSQGSSSKNSIFPSNSQEQRHRPEIGMKVSFVSWLCIMGPWPGSASQKPKLKPSLILMAAFSAACAPTGETRVGSPSGGWKPIILMSVRVALG